MGRSLPIGVNATEEALIDYIGHERWQESLLERARLLEDFHADKHRRHQEAILDRTLRYFPPTGGPLKVGTYRSLIDDHLALPFRPVNREGTLYLVTSRVGKPTYREVYVGEQEAWLAYATEVYDRKKLRTKL